MEKIHWAAKVNRTKIWRLYQNDARGTIDEALVEDVGWALFQRCQSILMVSRGQLECPRCGAVFSAPNIKPENPGFLGCPVPNCSWQTPLDEYHKSWRHQDLIGSNALPSFEAFITNYPKARTVRARTFLIDQLIHAFHWDMKQGVPNRSAGNNLIVGSHQEVVAFLDTLSSGEANGIGTEEEKAQWRETVQRMWKRRKAIK
jgi:hypothetical protein